MRWSRAGIVVVGLLAVLPAEAQESDSLLDRWEFRVGVFFPQYDTDVRRDSDRLGTGTSLDLEQTLGLDDSDEIGRFLAGYRIARRHQLRFGYYDWAREGRIPVSFEIRFGDDVFPVDVELDTKWDAKLWELRYSYWPVLEEKTAFAVNVGVVTWNVDLELDAVGSNRPIVLNSSASIDELVPEIGIEWRRSLAPDWMLRIAVNGIIVDLSDVEGEVFEGFAGVEYYPWKNVGIGLSFIHTDADVDVFETFTRAVYEVTLTGVNLYLPIRF